MKWKDFFFFFPVIWTLELLHDQEEASLFIVCMLPSPGLCTGESQDINYIHFKPTFECNIPVTCESLFSILGTGHHKFIPEAHLRRQLHYSFSSQIYI